MPKPCGTTCGQPWGCAFGCPFQIRPPQTWGIEYDWGISFTYNGYRVASFEKNRHATIMFCKPTKAELAKELREFALAANEAATHLEMG